MIITIGGLAGTGTTTATKNLSKFLDIPYISTGDVFRQMAVDNNMDILEFSEFAEGNDDIDKELDKRQAQIASESKELIVEGRLSAYFVDADYRIWLTAPEDVRAERISYREGKSVDTVKYEMKERTDSEKKRYQEIHNINISNLDIYDLVINTGTFDTETTAKIIIKCINEKINR
jgi:cytidylate kinase